MQLRWNCEGLFFSSVVLLLTGSSVFLHTIDGTMFSPVLKNE